MTNEHDQNSRLTYKAVFQVLAGWKHLVRVDSAGVPYDGRITDLLEDGTLQFRTVVPGEGERFMEFKLANADFEWSNNPAEWLLNGEPAEEVLTVFPHSGNSFMLLKWKK